MLEFEEFGGFGDCACAIVTFEDAAFPVCSNKRMSISRSMLCSSDSGTVRPGKESVSASELHF